MSFISEYKESLKEPIKRPEKWWIKLLNWIKKL